MRANGKRKIRTEPQEVAEEVSWTGEVVFENVIAALPMVSLLEASRFSLPELVR
jgi:hypothetical protein